MVNKLDYIRYVLYYQGVKDEQYISGISKEDRDRYEQIIKDNLNRGFTVDTLHLSGIEPSDIPKSTKAAELPNIQVPKELTDIPKSTKAAELPNTQAPKKHANTPKSTDRNRESNQYGKETLQKFTYSLNLGDPLALSISKQIETVIRNALEPLQQEGQRIQRTQRTTDNNGRRNTDYYIKSEYAPIAQKAVDNFIQKSAAKRETNIDAHISGVTPATFRTQTAAILDANVRADIGRIVMQNGGGFQHR
jgi:hypothetical protein